MNYYYACGVFTLFVCYLLTVMWQWFQQTDVSTIPINSFYVPSLFCPFSNFAAIFLLHMIVFIDKLVNWNENGIIVALMDFISNGNKTGKCWQI